MNKDTELKIQAWVDGELPASEANRVNRLVAADPEARSLAEGLRTLKAALKGNEPELKVPETREFYWSKIARQIEREEAVPARASVPWFVQWRRFLMPLAGVAGALALMLFTLSQFVPAPSFDEATDTSSEMEAFTFRDQNAGMTVVWLQEKNDDTLDSTQENEVQ